MDDDLFALVDTVFHQNDDLDPEPYRLLRKIYMGYIRHGLKLPAGCQRDRFREIQWRLIVLRLNFREIWSRQIVQVSGLRLGSWMDYRVNFYLC